MSGHTPESIIRCAELEVGPGSEDPDFIRLSKAMVAAPDLLEALDELVRHQEALGRHNVIIDKSRAAIAKARGEK